MRHFSALLLFIFFCAANPLAAQQITVRSGEHESFSRLVFMFPAGTEWQTERIDNGYRLSSTARTGGFDLSSVFRFIPKTRILSVTTEMGAKSVFIETAPETQMTSFQLPIGAVVIDIADGSEPQPALAPVAKGRSFLPQQDQSYRDLYWSDSWATLSRIQGPPVPDTAGDPRAQQVKHLAPPNPRITAAERELIDQLGRAASQGLIRMQLPKPQNHAAGENSDPTTAQKTPTGEPPNPLALQSETVIDRDTAATFSHSKLSSSGHSCPPDIDFDLQAWLNDKPPVEQIADARKDLLEEFDKPRASAVEHLAKVYLALGFGAEAKGVLHSFGMDAGASYHLSAIADIVDGRQPGTGEDFSAMASCNGKVALWAFLAAAETPPKESVNFGSTTRAYAALPATIRELIGPSLSKRLIEIGAADVAATVRSTLARTPLDHQGALDLVDAQIDLSAGRTASATARLEKVAQTNTPSAAESLVLAIETKLAQGQTIPVAEAEHAGALARQLKRTEIGDKLHRAGILGFASSAQFDRAFAAWDSWPISGETALADATLNDIFALLARAPDEPLFLETYFRHRHRGTADSLSPEVQIALADRLSDNGFAQSARTALSTNTRQTNQGRLALARAALADRDAAAAYSHLLGLTNDDAAKLRGEALSILGQHEIAKDEFARAGDREAQLDEAWRAGSWDLVARHGSDSQKRFLELFGQGEIPPVTGAPPETRGPLAQAQRLISRSEAERTAFSQIMQDIRATPPPEN